MKFAEKFARLCKDREWSDEGIAQRLGDAHKYEISDSTVRRWRKGMGVPDINEAFWLAQMFDVPIEYLVDEEVDTIPKESHWDRVLRDLVREHGSEALVKSLMGGRLQSNQ